MSASTPGPLPQALRERIAAQLGDAKPATDKVLTSLAASVADRRAHEHPAWEDLYCLNLVSWAGERMAPVLRRLLDAEARVAELEAAPTLVYRADHSDSGIVLGTYSSREAAATHCETVARREGSTGLVSWVPEDGSHMSPEELTFFDVECCDGDDVPVQTCTGYVVTPVEVASEHDEEADA
ncbi:SPOR domain-containing protein [Streptomyces sp. NPDC006684]|uniref:SPOR domain-containing protein n=1 Tax=Streptomyces sp. NPDC006684 TaxID=3154477 RepID=UPI0034530187